MVVVLGSYRQKDTRAVKKHRKVRILPSWETEPSPALASGRREITGTQSKPVVKYAPEAAKTALIAARAYLLTHTSDY